MSYDVDPGWLSPNNPTSSHLKETFLMDFTMTSKRGEGIHKRLFFSSKFSHPKERFIDHLRTMRKSHSEYYWMMLTLTIKSPSLLIISGY